MKYFILSKPVMVYFSTAESTLIPPEQEYDEYIQVIDIKDIKEGSELFVLEAAIGIYLGKIAQFGYETVADFFKNEPRKITRAHNLWLIIEAVQENRKKDMIKEFPDAPRQASNIIKYMSAHHIEYMNRLKKRMNRSFYSLRQ